ncbi:MAG TPA: LysR family transcriptional regulator [Acetobacteraceae bacterium]|jgi:LysR family nitrogen assimilation transcriptional regulator|nr:LysR family transcriptional regulator [Acetobacteraceae bacterium]HTB44946.1 LysR family transcriptional regulator [Acetobacteraceae bacterium]
MAIDLRQLRYFVAVAETGSFSAAAGTLRIAQSALSRQVQALEQACGGPLMERSVRGIVLTESGELLLARARFLLGEAANAVTEVSELNSEPGGLVRLAAPPSFGYVLYPLLATTVTARWPRVQLELREQLNDGALEELRHGALDLAVVSAPATDPLVSYELLCAEPMILAGPPGDPRLAVASFSLQDLAELPLILPIGGGWLSIAQRRLGGQMDLAYAKARVLVQSPGPIKAMLKAGLGYSVLPASVIQQDLADGNLAGAPIADFNVPRVLAISQARPSRRAVDIVAQAIRDEVALLVQAGALGWFVPPPETRHRSAPGRAKRRPGGADAGSKPGKQRALRMAVADSRTRMGERR